MVDMEIWMIYIEKKRKKKRLELENRNPKNHTMPDQGYEAAATIILFRGPQNCIFHRFDEMTRGGTPSHF
jgi:hypothetical protein